MRHLGNYWVETIDRAVPSFVVLHKFSHVMIGEDSSGVGDRNPVPKTSRVPLDQSSEAEKGFLVLVESQARHWLSARHNAISSRVVFAKGEHKHDKADAGLVGLDNPAQRKTCLQSQSSEGGFPLR